jgi:hypothetical protein
MTEHKASRTLVKSPPELWAECSDAAALARHLGELGEIRIIKLEPETSVAWEGDEARGTVRLEPSGWGTRVILTAAALEPEPEVPEVPGLAEVLFPEPEVPKVVVPVRAAGHEGFFARLWRRLSHGSSARAEVVSVVVPVEPSVEPDGPPLEPDGVPGPAPSEQPSPEHKPPELDGLLSAALESLGSAHHRPFSRA